MCVIPQVFALSVYLTGLASFALLLALVEQTVTQVYELQVKQVRASSNSLCKLCIDSC